MTARTLTATHTQILRILTWNSFKLKHINYVVKCLGYKDLKESIFVYSCLTSLKRRGFVSMAQQFHFDHETGKSFTVAEESRWSITDKGKIFLENA